LGSFMKQPAAREQAAPRHVATLVAESTPARDV
jgi:hypothetical protein